MEGFKNILLSNTFWGALISIISPYIGKIGLVPFTTDENQMMVGLIVGVLGGIYAIIGRIIAKRKIVLGSAK